MSATTTQLLAVSALVGECEAITASGVLSERTEQRLRWLTAQTTLAFNIPARWDRAARLIAVGDHQPEPANLNETEAAFIEAQETLRLLFGGAK